MDLDQLHTFLEIVRLKSFSKAAQTCYRTQPAISAQVRQLEQELNTTLFERLGTKISLTTAGKIFAEYAEQILDLRRRAQDTINELDRVPRGELVIAANEATCIYVLPSVFSEYKKKFPNVQLSVDRAYGSRVVEAVLENLADFGITQLPVQEKKLQVARIHSDEIILLLPGQASSGGQTLRDGARSDGSAAAAAQDRHHAHPLEFVARTGGGPAPHFDGTGFHRDDQTLRNGRVRLLVPGGIQLPRRDCGRQTVGGIAGSGTADSQGGFDLPKR